MGEYWEEAAPQTTSPSRSQDMSSKIISISPYNRQKKINKSSNKSALSSLPASHNPYTQENKITWRGFWGFWGFRGFRRDPADVGEEVHVLLRDHLGDVREVLCFLWILKTKTKKIRHEFSLARRYGTSKKVKGIVHLKRIFLPIAGHHFVSVDSAGIF